MALDKATVRRIAKLARIRLEEDELEPMGVELGRILEWIEQLNEVDTADVPAMIGAEDHALRRRPDAITDGRYQDKVLANAPDSAGGFYAVPKVVE
jgi:aspartyl-tRNA(Asn)/glutamyl-tRNA(Gln) amidotransferase subunit C